MPIEDFFVPISSGVDRRTPVPGLSPPGPGRESQRPDLPVPPKSFAQTLREHQRPPAEKAPPPASTRTTEAAPSPRPAEESSRNRNETGSTRSATQSEPQQSSIERTPDSSQSTTAEAPQNETASPAQESASTESAEKAAPPAPHVPLRPSASQSPSPAETPPDVLVPPVLAFLQEWLLSAGQVEATETPAASPSGELLTPPTGFLETLGPSTSVPADSQAGTPTSDIIVQPPARAPDAIVPAEILEPIVETITAEATGPAAGIPVIDGSTEGTVSFEPTAFEADGAANRTLEAAVTVVPVELSAEPAATGPVVPLDGLTAQENTASIPAGVLTGQTPQSAVESQESRPAVPLPASGPVVLNEIQQQESAKPETVESSSSQANGVATDRPEAGDSAELQKGLEKRPAEPPPASAADPSPTPKADREPSGPPPDVQDESVSAPAEDGQASTKPAEDVPHNPERAEADVRRSVANAPSPSTAALEENLSRQQRQPSNAPGPADAESDASDAGRQQPNVQTAAATRDRDSRSSSEQPSGPAVDATNEIRQHSTLPQNHSPIGPAGHTAPESGTRSTEAAGSMRVAAEAATNEKVAPASLSGSGEASNESSLAGAGRTAPPSARADGSNSPVSSAVRTDAAAEQVVDRAAAAIRQSHDQGRQLRIRLHPPELGALQVDVTVRDGAVSARLEVQTAAAHQTLVEHLGQLREALSQSGAPVERIDVQLADPTREDGRPDGQPRQDGQSSDREGRQQQSRRDPHQRQQAPEEETPEAGDQPPPHPPEGDADQLNIQI